MSRRRLRAALAVALAAPLVVGPVVAQAESVPLQCGGRKIDQTGLWQRLPIAEFRGVENVPGTRDAVTAYSVDAARPDRLLVTNGNTVKRSVTAGCSWTDVLVLGAQGDDGVPLSGTTSTVVATASLPGGPSLALVREGTGAASRPHVASSPEGANGSWRETSSGLPAQGSPRLLEAAGDGRTAYLTISPVTDAGGSGSGLPSLPGGAAPAGPAGFLYATTDGGRTWSQRGSLASLPSGSTGFDALAVDAADPDLLYAISDGRLVVSRDGGRTLTPDPGIRGATAVEPMDRGEVAVLTGSTLQYSNDGARDFAERPAPPGGGSAAYRPGDGALVVEADGGLFRVEARAGGRGPVLLDAGVPATRGSARGTRSDRGTFSALGGNSLLRYVDPVVRPVVEPPLAPGDQRVPPPPPGRMDPPSRSVTLPVGESRLVDFSLVLDRSPTPLDLYLLVDVSEGMADVLRDVRANLRGVADEISAQGIDLRVGLGTVAAGPREGEAPYPEVDPTNPDYRKPDVYKRLRAVGEVDDDLRRAVDSLRVQRPPANSGNPPEGQLAGLEQLMHGNGFADPRLGGEATGMYVIPPGQQAEFRDAPGIRKFVALATDERFTDPYGTPLNREGKPDLDGVGARLRERGIKVIGLTAREGASSKADLQKMARLTGTFAPAGGVDCGDQVFLRAGEPLVCDSSRNFSDVLGRALRGLADRQSVALVPKGPRALLGDVSAAGLRDLDVTVPNRVPFQVRVSCVDVAAGRYSPSVDAVLRGTVVATAELAVTCTAPAAAAAVAPPRPPAAQLQDPVAPAGQPAAQAPAPPAPAPPVVQPQAQPQAQAQTQTQVQVNPMTAAMLQQQQELQLALALSADERPASTTEYAMVDRGRGEQLRALALLAVSMAGASAAGLARLRTRREDGVRVRRVL